MSLFAFPFLRPGELRRPGPAHRPDYGRAVLVALCIVALACSEGTSGSASGGGTGATTGGVDTNVPTDVGGGAADDVAALADSAAPADDSGSGANGDVATAAETGVDSAAADIASDDTAASGQDSSGVPLDVALGDTGGENGDADGENGDADGEDIACMGSVYPDAGLIDPDNPIFESEYRTQDDVTKAFSIAKADGTNAYKAYKAAFENPDVLLCAFCPCGCHNSSGHQSAIDCFKDLHGFG